jgi:hypothetical protein
VVDEETSEDHSVITDKDDHDDFLTTEELLAKTKGMELLRSEVYDIGLQQSKSH